MPGGVDGASGGVQVVFISWSRCWSNQHLTEEARGGGGREWGSGRQGNYNCVRGELAILIYYIFKIKPHFETVVDSRGFT